MKAARIIFGAIFLLGAAFNIYIAATMGFRQYATFPEATFWPWYYDAWQAVAVPHITLIVILLICFEIGLGLLYIFGKRFLKIALLLGTLFCLASMPTMIEAIYTNLPLALIQAFLFWIEMRRDPGIF